MFKESDDLGYSVRETLNTANTSMIFIFYILLECLIVFTAVL